MGLTVGLKRKTSLSSEMPIMHICQPAPKESVVASEIGLVLNEPLQKPTRYSALLTV